MKKIKIITDMTADLTEDYIKEHNIDVIPMYYHFDGDTIYGDEIKLSVEEFYERFKTSLPKTMGCNPDKIKEKIEKAIKEGLDVLCIMFSSGCSVSYNSALIAKDDILDDYPNANIEVIDSKNGSMAEGYMVKEARRLSLEGLNLKDIKEYLETNRHKFKCLFSVSSLETLRRSGRISHLTGIVGTLISLKPVFTFDDIEGKLFNTGTKRGLNKVFREISDKIKEFKPKEITITHANDLELANKIKAFLIEDTNIDNIKITNLNFCTSASTGQGSFGVSFYK